MLKKVVKTKYNTYDVSVQINKNDYYFLIESQDKIIKEECWGIGTDIVHILTTFISNIENRDIFQEQLFKAWDGVID